ncbi:hypothetical protein ABMA27_000207 [Loxostege sticticalis]|uniref:NUCB1-like N-terminal domain-containing protein n=1 Tax=Loxostege sticticalis TaxID=481309 RepID=A0ABR3IMJ1_LOXSC
MRLLPSLLCLLVVLHCSYAPPVTPEKKDSEIKDDLEEYMEYHRYLQEVVQALESDPDFRERLEKADEDDVRSGKIAEQLDFVNHNVRTKLDEIKRRELDRLRHLATKQYELTNELDAHQGKVPSNEHLDHGNPHTFEIEDLKRLIKKTTADLQAADKKREQEFKEYEMQKEFEKHQKLETLDETQKKEYLENIQKEENAKKQHQPLQHPVTRGQLLEIWKNADNMDAKDFNPKVFFMMHDVDGNGAWDADEVKALFIKELDKLYGPGGPNKDLHERAEEMERMREHVFKENDLNRDGLIEFNEFMIKTQNPEFNRDEGWKSIDENQIYTQQEYEEFEKRRLEELRYLQQHGLVDAHGRPVPGAQHKLHAYQQQKAYAQQQQQAAFANQQQFQQQPPQYQGQGQQYYPQGQIPQGQPPPQGYQQAPGQIPQPGYQGQPGQVPQPGYQGQPGQVPQPGYQGQPGQVPPQGYQQYQVPQGQPQQQYQGQVPPQNVNLNQGQPQAQLNNQVQPPQGQGQPAQVPVQNQQPQGQVPPAPGSQTQGQPPQVQGQAPQTQGQASNQIPQQGQAPPQQPAANH